MERSCWSLFVLQITYLAFFWITGTYRAERSPEIVQTLNDMGWIPFIGLSSTLVLQSAVFGWVILSASSGEQVLGVAAVNRQHLV